MYTFSIFFIAIFGLSSAYKPCIDYKSVEVDVNASFAVKKYYVIEHSECTSCENDEDWTWIIRRSLPKKICMTTKVKIRGESYTICLRCEYTETDFGTQSCELDTSSVKGAKTVGLKGIKKFAGTNNKSWGAVTFCLYGKEQWWMIVSTEPTLADSEKKAALQSLDKLGFDTKASKKGIIQFETFELSNC